MANITSIFSLLFFSSSISPGLLPPLPQCNLYSPLPLPPPSPLNYYFFVHSLISRSVPFIPSHHLLLFFLYFFFSLNNFCIFFFLLFIYCFCFFLSLCFTLNFRLLHHILCLGCDSSSFSSFIITTNFISSFTSFFFSSYSSSSSSFSSNLNIIKSLSLSSSSTST